MSHANPDRFRVGKIRTCASPLQQGGIEGGLRASNDPRHLPFEISNPQSPNRIPSPAVVQRRFGLSGLLLAAWMTLIRALVRRLQAGPSVSDAERAALGITVPDSGATAAGSPATRPVCEVDTAQRLRHTIDFTDEGTPTRKAKPAGVLGAEIWVKIGPTPPVDPGELTVLAVDTRSPYAHDYPGSEGGKQAHYMLRWVNTRGETGPWSETSTATIGA